MTKFDLTDTYQIIATGVDGTAQVKSGLVAIVTGLVADTPPTPTATTAYVDFDANTNMFFSYTADQVVWAKKRDKLNPASIVTTS